jgi:hypothetical protein
MKTKLLLGLFCSFSVLCTAQRAQSTEQTPSNVVAPGQNEQVKSRSIRSEAKGDSDLTVYWSEDFSNGLDGQEGNGPWTTDGPNSDLWFHTFPVGMEGGYDDEAALPEEYQDAYGLFIPNWAFGYDITLESETPDNGYMMMDADRFNSTATDPEFTGNAYTTENMVNASLESPPIDLTDVPNAVVTFYQDWRTCCNDYSILMEFSADGGESWFTYDIFTLSNGVANVRTTGPLLIDVSDVLAGSADVSDCRIRFEWNPALSEAMTHYYLILDDVAIKQVPENDLSVSRTWYNKAFELADVVPDTEYLSYAQYNNQPTVFTHPFNFACEVSNDGTQTQTGVQMKVTINSPDEAVEPEIFYSDPIEMEPGDLDTLRAYDIVPDMWQVPDTGVYEINYEVIQNEDEQNPDNNIGGNLFTRVSSPLYGDGGIMQNVANNNTNYPFAGEDVLWGTRYVFSNEEIEENIVITHVDFIVQSGSNVQTQIGELCYVNVLTGDVFQEESAENIMTQYFDLEELPYVIEEESLSGNDYGLNWISYELPTPILISPNLIYQGEVYIPVVGVDVIFIGMNNGQEIYGGVEYDFAAPSSGPQGWYYIGGNVNPMIRFRVDNALGIEKITYDSGIKLTQNYPNPFENTTTIQFQLDESSDVTLEVFDLSGKLVRLQNLGHIPALSAEVVEFDRLDLSSGVYTYSILAKGERVTRKMTIE